MVLGEGMGGAQAQLRTRTRINPSPKRSYISTWTSRTSAHISEPGHLATVIAPIGPKWHMEALTTATLPTIGS